MFSWLFANHQRKVPARKGGAFLLVCKQLFAIFIRRLQVSCSSW